MIRAFNRPFLFCWSRWLAVFLLTGCVTACASGADMRSAWLRTMDQARQYARMGDLSVADDKYRQATWLARTLEENAESRIALADFLVDKELYAVPAILGPLANEDDSGLFLVNASQENLRNAMSYYREAIDYTRRESPQSIELQRLEVTAVNNLSTVLLRLFRGAEAVKEMSRVLPHVPDEDRSRFLYNHGLCLEQARRPQDALRAYVEALRSGQEVRPALTRALRLVEKLPEAADETLDLVAALLPLRELGSAGLLLSRLASRPEHLKGDLAPRFALTIAHYLTEAALAPEEFDLLWKDNLGALAGALDEGTQGMITDLIAVYQAPPPATFEIGAEDPLFAGWYQAPETRQAFAAFLQAVGHLYSRSKRPDLAISRFSLAFAVDPANPIGLIYSLNILAESPGDLDPTGRVLDSAAAIVQREVRPAWLAEPGASTDVYALLGKAFEARFVLDGPKALHRAIATWEMALATVPDSGSAEATDSFPHPILHQDLARAYASLDQPERSFQHYLAAAEALTRIGGDGAARDLIAKARLLPYRPSRMEQVRLAALLPDEPPPNTPVIITAFLDPSTADAMRTVPILRRVRDRYRNDQVRLVFWPEAPPKDFAESEAVMCAAEQGKLTEMQDLLFKESHTLSVAELKERAAPLGIEPEAFGACLDSGKYNSLVKAQIEVVDDGELSGHTVVFVNGRLTASSKTSSDLFLTVDTAVQKQTAVTAPSPP
ncbi:MAG TPA: hypothetical protein VNW71_10150 [Thermoanaerobaculia bacterium]|nr:hypothetical protein [Thermoanaerobaculia bacterium]